MSKKEHLERLPILLSSFDFNFIWAIHVSPFVPRTFSVFFFCAYIFRIFKLLFDKKSYTFRTKCAFACARAQTHMRTNTHANQTNHYIRSHTWVSISIYGFLLFFITFPLFFLPLHYLSHHMHSFYTHASPILTSYTRKYIHSHTHMRISPSLI